jgi:hypothetical protein
VFFRDFRTYHTTGSRSCHGAERASTGDDCADDAANYRAGRRTNLLPGGRRAAGTQHGRRDQQTQSQIAHLDSFHPKNRSSHHNEHNEHNESLSSQGFR